MCLSAVLGLTSAAIGKSSADKATNAHVGAANDQLALQERIYNEQSNLFSPFVTGGQNALAAYLYEMGLGSAPTIGGTAPQVVAFDDTVQGAPVNQFTPGLSQYDQRVLSDGGGTLSSQNQTVTRYRVGDQVFNTEDAANAYAQANVTGGTEYGGYTATPGYDFRLNEGLGALENSAAARGGLYSGAAMKSALQYGQDYATGEYNNYLSRLSGLASSGQNAAGMQGAAAQNYGANAGNAYASIGNAQAAGAIGAGNAWQSGLNNLSGYFGYQSQQNPQAGTLNSLFNGSWAIG